MPVGSKTTQHFNIQAPRYYDYLYILQSDLTAYRATWQGIKCMQLVPKLGIMVELLQ